MSHIQNDKWVEAAYQNFSEALELGQWDMAKAVIRDVQLAGFDEFSQGMKKEFNHVRFEEQ